MDFGFCVRVLVLSLLTFRQHANALNYGSGGSSGIKPLFDYPRNHKLALVSDYESSAQPGGFLGSSGSSHSEGGQVDRYSPEGSVSRYRSGSLMIRKPTKNTQMPPQTNSNANGVIQPKAGMWDLVLPQNGKRFESGIASSKEIIMQAGPQPPAEPQQAGYQPTAKTQQLLGLAEPQHPGYQPPAEPQHPGYQPPAEPQQPGYPSPSQPQQAGYPSQQVAIQRKAGIWDIFLSS